MAQKKITIELTTVQFEHVKQAVRDAQDDHNRDHNRANTALTGAQKAFDTADVERAGLRATEDDLRIGTGVDVSRLLE